MATVNLRLRGGPCDGERTTIDANDPNNPPELHIAYVHGAHEGVESCEYHRVRRELDSQADVGVWIYEAACESPM